MKARAIIFALLCGAALGLTGCSPEPKHQPLEFVPRSAREKQYKPYSVVCNGNGLFAVTDSEGWLNPYHTFFSHEDAQADGDWRKAGCPGGTLQDEIARENRKINWRPCEHETPKAAEPSSGNIVPGTLPWIVSVKPKLKGWILTYAEDGKSEKFPVDFTDTIVVCREPTVTAKPDGTWEITFPAPLPSLPTDPTSGTKQP